MEWDGVFAYSYQTFATEDMIATLPAEQQAEFLVEYPSWVTAAFALAVFCGFLASISLLFRKKWAYNLFVISAVAAFAQHIYILMNIEVRSYLMPALVIIVCVFLIWFSRQSILKQWIH